MTLRLLEAVWGWEAVSTVPEGGVQCCGPVWAETICSSASAKHKKLVADFRRSKEWWDWYRRTNTWEWTWKANWSGKEKSVALYGKGQNSLSSTSVATSAVRVLWVCGGQGHPRGKILSADYTKGRILSQHLSVMVSISHPVHSALDLWSARDSEWQTPPLKSTGGPSFLPMIIQLHNSSSFCWTCIIFTNSTLLRNKAISLWGLIRFFRFWFNYRELPDWYLKQVGYF